MSYLVVYCNGEESFNIFLRTDPDPDHLRGGPSHGYNVSCVKSQVNLSNSFSYAHRQTNRPKPPGARVMKDAEYSIQNSYFQNNEIYMIVSSCTC